MSIRDRVTQDMKAAMAARDQARLDALRLIRAEILKADKETGQPIDDDQQMAVLQKMLKQRQEAIEQYVAGGRPEQAEQERQEAAIIQAYLPEPLDEAAIRETIDAVLAEAGAVDAKQMGRIIGAVMGKLKATGRPFDGRHVNQLVREKLGA